MTRRIYVSDSYFSCCNCHETGANITLPSAQNIGPGITINGGNDTFTIANAGRYYITYQINLTAGLLVSSRLQIIGAANLASTISPAVSLSFFNNDII